MKVYPIVMRGLPVVLALVMIGCGAHNTKKSDDRTIPVTTLEPHTIDLPETFVADIQGVQFVEIRPRVAGFIEEIFVDEGQKVNKGDRLFQISSTEYSENVREAKAHLKQAEAEYQMAVYEKSRISRLVGKNIISSTRLLQSNSEVEVAELKVEQARAQLKRSNVNLDYTIIHAPCSGYIDLLAYKVGSLVNVESLLTSISDISDVLVYFKMNETEYLEYKREQINGGASIQSSIVDLVLPDGSIYEHKGRIETIEGDFERGTGSIAFRARFPNPDGLLRHGVTGKINMTTKLHDIFLIPQQSTFEVQEFTYVYVVDKDNIVHIRSFKPIGRYDGFYITKDFEQGVQIVYSGLQSVKDGVEISPEMRTFTQIEQETTTTHKK